MMGEPNHFSLRWYLPGHGQEKTEIVRFFQWFVVHHTLPTRLIVTVSGRESIKSWVDSAVEDTSFVWIPDSPSAPAFFRLAFGSYLNPPKPFGSWREMMDACIYELIGCAIDYLISFDKDPISDRIIMQRRHRLMRDWIDFVDNGVCGRKEKSWRQRFFKGCGNRDFALLQRMVEDGPCLDFKVRGCTPLGLAVEKGDMRLARFLIGHGATVNMFYSDWTAIHAAAAYGRKAILEFLLDHGGNPKLNDTTYKRKTPFQYAVTFNQRAVVRLFESRRCPYFPVSDDRNES